MSLRVSVRERSAPGRVQDAKNLYRWEDAADFIDRSCQRSGEKAIGLRPKTRQQPDRSKTRTNRRMAFLFLIRGEQSQPPTQTERRMAAGVKCPPGRFARRRRAASA